MFCSVATSVYSTPGSTQGRHELVSDEKRYLSSRVVASGTRSYTIGGKCRLLALPRWRFALALATCTRLEETWLALVLRGAGVQAECLKRGVFAGGFYPRYVGAAVHRVRGVVDTAGTRLAVRELARSHGLRHGRAPKRTVDHVGLSFWAEEIQKAAEEGRKW